MVNLNTVNEIIDEYKELEAELRTQRDDIKVRFHLLTLDGQKEWEELEQKYDRLRGKLKKTSEAAEKSSADVKAAVDTLVKELKAGYKRIKSTL